MAAAATKMLLRRPTSRNFCTRHRVNGSQRAVANWPLASRRRMATSSTTPITTTATTDRIRACRRPRGPRASASTGAVIA